MKHIIKCCSYDLYKTWSERNSCYFEKYVSATFFFYYFQKEKNNEQQYYHYSHN